MKQSKSEKKKCNMVYDWCLTHNCLDTQCKVKSEREGKLQIKALDNASCVKNQVSNLSPDNELKINRIMNVYGGLWFYNKLLKPREFKEFLEKVFRE